MKIFFIMLKDFKLLLRDRMSILLMTAVPIVVISVAGIALSGIYGKTGSGFKIYLPVVDLDGRELSGMLPEILKKSGVFTVEMVSEDEAYRLVRDTNKAAAALIIPKDFTKNCLTGNKQKLILLTDPAKAIEISAVKSALKEFESRISLTLQAMRNIKSSTLPLLFSLNPELTASKFKSMMEKEYSDSLVVEEENLTGIKKNLTSFDQNVPGFSIMFAMFGMLYGFSESVFKERDEDRTLRRFLSAPVGITSLLAGKLIAKITTGFFQMMILFAFGYYAFDMSLGNSLAGIVITALGISFSAASIGLFVSSISNTREQARSMGTLVILTLSGLGGCWWPLFIEPSWMQKLSYIAMPAWGMNCFYNFMLRGKDIAASVYYLAGLYAYGTVILIAGLAIFSRWDERRLL